MYDIFSVGGTALDVFLQINEASVNCRLDSSFCQLCMNYADKIPVEKIHFVAGVGTAPNNAVGSSRLGLKAGLYTIVGDDSSGRESIDILKKEKVSVKYVVKDKKAKTDYTTAITFQGERTMLMYQTPRVYKLPVGLKTKWLFLGGMPNGHKALYEQIIKKVRKEGVKLGYNPGNHELRGGIDALKNILSVTEVFILNKEEAYRLVGKDSNIEKLASKLYSFGPKIVVVTDGKNGAVCFDGHSYYSQTIFNLPVVEKTGAGDAFATGFVAALIHGLELKEALRWGAANAAFVVQHIGAQKGLLTKREMIKFLDRD